VVGVVGVFGGPQSGPLVGLTTLNDVYRPTGRQPSDKADAVDLDVLVREFDTTPRAADLTYNSPNKEWRIHGIVERLKKDSDNNDIVVLQGKEPNHKVECVFDDPDEFDADVIKKNARVTIEGTCEGRAGIGHPVRFSSCKLVK